MAKRTAVFDADHDVMIGTAGFAKPNRKREKDRLVLRRIRPEDEEVGEELEPQFIPASGTFFRTDHSVVKGIECICHIVACATLRKVRYASVFH